MESLGIKINQFKNDQEQVRRGSASLVRVRAAHARLKKDCAAPAR
jgi:hypothetical protein